MPEIVFSVVIPVFNEEKFIAPCIESVKKQIGDFCFEILVVDSCCTDNTIRIAREMGARVVETYSRGVGLARKIGTEAAIGRYIVHLDADTRLPSNYLFEVYARFQRNEKLVCLGGQFFFYDGSWWKNILRRPFFYFLRVFAEIVSRRRIGPCGNNMVFKKEIYDKTSGFDEKIKFGEDADLCRKLSLFGEIKLDMSLRCFASSRRFKVGSWKFYVMIYFFIKMLFNKKTYNYVLPHSKEM